jgi:hypothetical protein
VLSDRIHVSYGTARFVRHLQGNSFLDSDLAYLATLDRPASRSSGANYFFCDAIYLVKGDAEWAILIAARNSYAKYFSCDAIYLVKVI